MSSSNHTEQINNESFQALPFGHFRLRMPQCTFDSMQNANYSNDVDIVCKSLTQEDYADGWRTVLPKPRKNKQPVHHWSVTLAQLPPHLWSKIRQPFYNSNGEKTYHVIKDKNYYYSVMPSEFDDTLISLYDELQEPFHFNVDRIREHLDELGNMNSWLVIRGRKIVNNKLDTSVVYN